MNNAYNKGRFKKRRKLPSEKQRKFLTDFWTVFAYGVASFEGSLLIHMFHNFENLEWNLPYLLKHIFGILLMCGSYRILQELYYKVDEYEVELND